MPHSYDVIILGLGGMGSSAAYHAAARGRRVLGLERFGPVHTQGSSHGDSRIIRQAYHEHPNYVPLALRAYELWRRLEQDSRTSILHPTGGLMIGPPGSSVVEGAIRSAKLHNLPYETLDSQELRRRFPVLNPRSDETAMYEAVAGYVRPEIAIQAHLDLAARHGAHLHFEEPAIAWSANSSGTHVTVNTGRASYEAGRLVIAPGAWATELLSDIGIAFNVQRHVMCWFKPVAHAAGFLPENFPIFIWDADGANCFYGFPITGDSSEGVKAAMHSNGKPCTIQRVDRDIHDSDISEVRDYLERFIPSLNGPLVRAVTCLYTLTPDEHFVVANHPSYPQVAIAAGFSGHGFKFSSVVGELMADLVVDGRTAFPTEFLAPARFAK
jgi:sarcosine oxidase